MENQPSGSELSLEKALKALEDIVERLSAPAEDLDQIIALYERGVEYLNICKARLKEAETKINLLNARIADQGKNEDNNG